MSFLKRTNKNRAAIPVIMVAGGDQALATGNLNTAGTAFNIANAQLGVLSYDPDGTKKTGTFLAAGDDVTEVNAIKIVAGTPVSSNTQNADLWEVGNSALVESGVIYGNKIRSVYTKKARYGQYGAEAVTSVPTIVDNEEYTAKIRLLSVTNDKVYGDNDEVMSFSVPAVDYTIAGIPQPKDYVVQQIVDQINGRSKVVGQNSAFRKGNRNLVAFGIKIAGGAGQALGTITVGTSVNFITKNGITSTFVFDIQAVTALAQLVNSNADLTPTSTLELVNVATAGATAKVDAFVVLGLPRTLAAYYDNVEQVQTRVEVNLGGKFITSATKPVVTTCFPDEGTNQGSKLSIMSRDRYLLTVHTMQNHPHGEWFAEGKDYIDPTKLYTTYIIEHYDVESVLNTHTESPKFVYVLFPCEKASAFTPTVTNIATRIAAGDTPVQMVTSTGAGTGTASVNTVPSVVAVLDAWLESARQKYSFELGGEATAGGAYLV